MRWSGFKKGFVVVGSAGLDGGDGGRWVVLMCAGHGIEEILGAMGVPWDRLVSGYML